VRIGVRMHGVTLNLECPHAPLLEHTAALLGAHAGEPWPRPDLEVTGRWLTPASLEESRRPVFELDGLDAFGKRMHLDDEQLVWTDTYRDKNLQLRFRRGGRVPAFDVAYQYLPSKKKLAKYADYERKKYFDLLRYLVFFPIAWQLRRTRGWEMIHASAVSDGERAVLIAGPGGAGKTTTSVALVARAGMQLLSENLVFCDGELAFPVCEPIRLTPESLGLLGESADALRPFESPVGLKTKAMFVPPVEPDAPGVRPAVLFLARFTSEGFARETPPSVACELIKATNVLTLELNDFMWYSAALDLLWPGETADAGDRVEALTRNTPCYSLGIDRTAGVGSVVDRVLACLNGRAEPRPEPMMER